MLPHLFENHHIWINVRNEVFDFGGTVVRTPQIEGGDAQEGLAAIPCEGRGTGNADQEDCAIDDEQKPRSGDEASFAGCEGKPQQNKTAHGENR